MKGHDEIEDKPLPDWIKRPQRPAGVPETLGLDDDSRARRDALREHAAAVDRGECAALFTTGGSTAIVRCRRRPGHGPGVSGGHGHSEFSDARPDWFRVRYDGERFLGYGRPNVLTRGWPSVERVLECEAHCFDDPRAAAEAAVAACIVPFTIERA